jgi:hypothetical protein
MSHILFHPNAFPGSLVATAVVIAVAKLIYCFRIRLLLHLNLLTDTINDIGSGRSDVELNTMLAQMQTSNGVLMVLEVEHNRTRS